MAKWAHLGCALFAYCSCAVHLHRHAHPETEDAPGESPLSEFDFCGKLAYGIRAVGVAGASTRPG